LTIFNFGTDDQTLATTEYSTDGVNWTTLTQHDSQANGTGNPVTTGLNPPTITLPQPSSKLYYRVTFQSLEDGVNDDNQFTANRNQWNRTGVNAPLFEANFTLIPEPGSLALIGVGLAALLGRRRKV